MRRSYGLMWGLLAALLVAVAPAPSRALEAGDFPYPGMRVLATPHGFGDLVKRLDAAIETSGLFAMSRELDALFAAIAKAAAQAD